MAIIKTGTFTVATGGVTQYLNLGFIPSVLTLWNDTVLSNGYAGTGGTGIGYAQWLANMTTGPTDALASSAYIQTLTAGAPVWTQLRTNAVTPFMTPYGAEFVPLTGLPPNATNTSLAITGISKAANASITATHAFTAADIGVTTVTFHGIVGMTQMNTLSGLITGVTSTTSFTVNINSAAFSTFVASGTPIANIITGVPPVTQTGFQVYNTPLYNVGFIGVALGGLTGTSALLLTTADFWRYEAVLATPVTS